MGRIQNQDLIGLRSYFIMWFLLWLHRYLLPWDQKAYWATECTSIQDPPIMVHNRGALRREWTWSFSWAGFLIHTMIIRVLLRFYSFPPVIPGSAGRQGSGCQTRWYTTFYPYQQQGCIGCLPFPDTHHVARYAASACSFCNPPIATFIPRPEWYSFFVSASWDLSRKLRYRNYAYSSGIVHHSPDLPLLTEFCKRSLKDLYQFRLQA